MEHMEHYKPPGLSSEDLIRKVAENAGITLEVFKFTIIGSRTGKMPDNDLGTRFQFVIRPRRIS